MIKDFFKSFFFNNITGEVYNLPFLYLTNLEQFLILNLLFCSLYFVFSVHDSRVIPHPHQNRVETFYNFISSTVKQQLGLDGQIYFIFTFTLFLFIVASNLIGLVPFSFTITSHILQTFSLGLSVTIAITIIGFLRHGLQFLTLFLPPGAPKPLAPLLIFIEVVSYVSRAFSLSIRLFANMMSGHTLLNIMTSFILKLFSKSFIFMVVSFLPFLIVCGIILLETGIAVLQAYVFVVLFSIYLNDAYHLSH
jgi:ATP synthase subunit 6